jgi:hypothetical protein
VIVYEGMHWTWGPYDLPAEGGFDIGDLLSAAQQALGELGYGNIENGGTEWYVCGSKGASIIVVIYTSNGGYSFTQTVVASTAGAAPGEETIAGQDVAAFVAKMKAIGWL